MQIVLVGLPPVQMQHLAAALQQVLTPINPNFCFHTPQLSPAWAPPTGAFRIMLFASLQASSTSTAWRQQLLGLGLSFQVIQADAQGFLSPCLMALLPAESVPGLSRQALAVRWQGVCETCSDPDCEMRLFSGLLQG